MIRPYWLIVASKRAGKEIDPSSVDLPDLKPWNPCGPQVETNDLYLTEFDKTTKDSVVLERLKKDKESEGKKKLKRWKPVLKILSAIHCQKVVKVFGTFRSKVHGRPISKDEYQALEKRMKARKEE